MAVDKLTVCDVPAGHVLPLWPHVRPYIESVLIRDGSGRFEAGDVLSALLRDDAKLWVAWNETQSRADAAIVTEIIQYPRLRELRIWLIGGRPGALRSWFADARDMLVEFARARECSFIRADSIRDGWTRLAGPDWRKVSATFEKRLT